ncbi:PREDICTED: AP-3 complex subunit sigma-2-like [Acropora digitifera]|uniref:AP-3 complex subunit sigma-2-like n=1 Tax=Acropora digitifera TaxID=70779 RepID=UPI000779F926|nr:PREDICTED: AP-3 complex subunit sigma-2-like [Acropora digitifera]
MPCSLCQKMRIVGYLLLNSSTLNELGSWCLKVWWIGEVIVTEEGGGSDFKIIYRHYATLYFVFCVDSSESELGILDLIQVFVETLDKCFENVCELDLIFHMDKV